MELTLASIGNVIKLATNGLKLGEYRPDDSQMKVYHFILSYPNEGRTLDAIDNLRVSTSKWFSSNIQFCRNCSK